MREYYKQVEIEAQKTQKIQAETSKLLSGKDILKNQVVSYFSTNTKAAKKYNEEIVALFANIDKASNLDELKKAQTAFRALKTLTSAEGNLGKTFFDKLNESAKKFFTWLTASGGIMLAIALFRKMITNVQELDQAMTELRKVTSETDAVYAAFLDNIAQRAKALGVTISDLVSATADFARLGYSLTDAGSLAEAASVYKNVGDGISSIGEASESIISTMKAFGIEASDAMSIVDEFNEVGKQNCPAA
jgi:hypothetical protein